MQENFGVANVTKLLLWAAGLTNKIVESIVDDGKVSALEGAGIAFETIAVPFQSFKFLEDEIKDLSEEEMTTINAAFQEKFNISKKEAEMWVEQSMSFALMVLYRFLSKHDEVLPVEVPSVKLPSVKLPPVEVSPVVITPNL